MTEGAIAIARREGKSATLTQQDLNDLAGRLDGSLLSPENKAGRTPC